MSGKMRENLTKHFVSGYFKTNAFYALRTLDGRIKDPEQRIANDIEEMCQTVTDMFTEAVQPALNLVTYGYVLSTLVDARGIAIVLFYNIIGVAFVHAFIPNYKQYA